MNYPISPISTPREEARLVSAPADLLDFKRSNVGAAVWMRAPENGFQSWIDGLAPEQLPSARVILKPEAVHLAVTSICDAAGMPDGQERDRFCGDVAALAHIFSAIMGTEYLRLRLDRISDNACRKFHLDAVTVRLVCTYRGTGTQYGVSSDGHAEPEEVATVPTGAPILLRGTLSLSGHDTRLRHRSPPILGTGETRLVLVLDPIADPEDEI